MIIKSVRAKPVRDSRGDKTIEVTISTDVGRFSASSPNGKSKGKFEAKPYKKSLDEDIKSLEKLSDYFSKEHIEKFDDLIRIEDIVKGHVGANTLFALESAALKAISKEMKKPIWKLINEKVKKTPRIVGNAVGGGLHSDGGGKTKPDFQEFLLISNEGSSEKNQEKNLEFKKELKSLLRRADKNFKEKKNDENAWVTTLNEKEVLDIFSRLKIPIGVDAATSSFYKRKKYKYKNPPIDRNSGEQLMYIQNLIKNYSIFYIEDPFEENDFLSHSKLLTKVKNCLIVGDDLIVTNLKRLKKAIDEKAVNAIIVKPNQNGSLIDVRDVVELAKKKNIKTVFSHRSGETTESILADLAVGFESEFIKCGITGKERVAKIKRLIEIEKEMKK